MLEIKEHFPYEFKLSPNKIVRYRGWKTKDEKAYLILVETKEEEGGLSDEDLFNVLIEPCIENKKMNFSTDEIQMLLIEIRKKSMGETFNIKFVCQNEKCNTVNETDVHFKDIVTFFPEKIDFFKDGDLSIQFGEIKNTTILKEKIKDQNFVEQKFIEMVLRIEKVIIGDDINDSFSYDDVYNYINNLDIAVYDKLIKYYLDNSASLVLRGSYKCMSCGEENKFVFDEIPNFLGDW
jgi:hypothetical protein